MKRLNPLYEIKGLSPRNGLLLLSGIIVAAGIGLLLLQGGVFDSVNLALPLDKIPVRKEWISSPFKSVPFSGKLIVNVVLVIATGVSFVLLDRTIFRPYFQRRAI